ncbi:TniQ family protein [Methylobacterium sp. C33D]
MARLYPFVPLLPGEAVTGFCSRLAAIHKTTSVRTFLRYLGRRFTPIVFGQAMALDDLAELTGIPTGEIVRSSLVRFNGHITHRGQSFPTTMSRGTRTFVCPRCLAEDEGHSRRNPIETSYGRTIWQLTPIQACPRHYVLLREISGLVHVSQAYDFSRAIWPHLSRMKEYAETAAEVMPSAAEAYLLSRFEEQRETSPLLDQMPWYAAARACEAMGAAALFGPAVTLGNLALGEKRQAADVGFQIAHGGEPAVLRFLDDLLRNHYTREGSNDGPGSMYGILNHLLTRPGVDPGYAPLRSIVFEHALGAAPFGPGDIIVGLPVARRRTHSLMTAAAEAGQHPDRLLKILIADGIIPRGASLNGRVVFDAAIAAPVLRRTTKLLNLRAIAEHLHTTYSYVIMLTTNGFIEPFKSDMVQEKVIRARYAKADIDAFMGRLVEGAVVHPQPERPFMDIPRAAKRTYCPMQDIIGMILKRKLRWVGVEPDKIGFHAILVNADEILEQVRGPEHDGYTMQKLRVRMKVGERVVQALVAGDYLPRVMRLNPVNRHPNWIVMPETIDAFERTYVSLSELADRWETNAFKLKKDLDRRGVIPAIRRDRVGATFYLRKMLL